MTTVTEDIIVRSFAEDGREGVELVTKPEHSMISLHLLMAGSPYIKLSMNGEYVTFCRQVTYRITGWDALHTALTISRVDE